MVLRLAALFESKPRCRNSSIVFGRPAYEHVSLRIFHVSAPSKNTPYFSQV